MYFVIKPMYNVQNYVFVNKYVNFNVPLNFNLLFKTAVFVWLSYFSHF